MKSRGIGLASYTGSTPITAQDVKRNVNYLKFSLLLDQEIRKVPALRPVANNYYNIYILKSSVFDQRKLLFKTLKMRLKLW